MKKIYNAEPLIVSDSEIVSSKKQSRVIAKQEKNARKRLEAEKANAKLVEYKNSVDYRVRQIAKEQDLSNINWSKLDNAGLIYPGIAYNNGAVYRLSVLLNIEVDPIKLQYAVNDVAPRFPTIVSTLRSGLFWYYLDAPSMPIVVEEETTFGCRPFKIDRRHSMVRVFYRKHEIIAEFFHTATDGTGGITFLNCLVSTYLHYCGIEVNDRTNNPHPKDKPRYEETVDSFQSAYDPKGERKTITEKACHLKAEKLPDKIVIYRKAIMDSKQLYDAAKKHNATITQYLSALIMIAIARHNEKTLNKDKKPIKISVPCNLRKYYNSQTLRNFSSYFPVYYQGGGFDATLAKVKEDFDKYANKNFFDNMINLNISAQRNLLMRIVVLPIKNLALKITYRRLGYALNSSSWSNLGIIKAPKEFEKYVMRYEFGFGPTFCEPIGVTCTTYNGTSVIMCASIVKDTMFEREFFSMLAADGVTLVAETSYGGTL